MIYNRFSSPLQGLGEGKASLGEQGMIGEAHVQLREQVDRGSYALRIRGMLRQGAIAEILVHEPGVAAVALGHRSQQRGALGLESDPR